MMKRRPEWWSRTISKGPSDAHRSKRRTRTDDTDSADTGPLDGAQTAHGETTGDSPEPPLAREEHRRRVGQRDVIRRLGVTHLRWWRRRSTRENEKAQARSKVREGEVAHLEGGVDTHAKEEEQEGVGEDETGDASKTVVEDHQRASDRRSRKGESHLLGREEDDGCQARAEEGVGAAHVDILVIFKIHSNVGPRERRVEPNKVARRGEEVLAWNSPKGEIEIERVAAD